MMNEINNKLYAPGIATYGARGKSGKNGNAGYGLYYVPYDIDLADDSLNNDNYKNIKNCIINNYYISSNSSQSQMLLDRVYQVNDICITTNGSIYRIKEIDTTNQNVKFELFGSLIDNTSYFSIGGENNNVIYNKNSNKFLITDNSTKMVDTSSLLTINCNSSNQNNIAKFITCAIDNDNKLSVYYDNSAKVFVIDSGEIPIIHNGYTNSDLTKYDSIEYTCLGNKAKKIYSPIYTINSTVNYTNYFKYKDNSIGEKQGDNVILVYKNDGTITSLNDKNTTINVSVGDIIEVIAGDGLSYMFKVIDNDGIKIDNYITKNN